MMRFKLLKRILVCFIIAALFVIFITISAQAQFLPLSYYYTSPLFYPSYSYSNTITGNLLGYLPFTPFLNPSATSLYTRAGITTYPFTYQILNQYTTTIPFTTLDSFSPYALPAYPSYLYGDPSWYAYWVQLNW
ncbi:MAG: hypothetical protein ACMUJM_03320 [bacterium]